MRKNTNPITRLFINRPLTSSETVDMLAWIINTPPKPVRGKAH